MDQINTNQINICNNVISLNKTIIMGILNVTPDSFYDGGKHYSTDDSISLAIQQAKKMIEEGADIIDIGGESSRPGSDPVSEEEELKRVIPIIQSINQRFPNIVISIDTYKPNVAEQAIKSGASIINDITGLQNPQMMEVAAKHNIPVIIMHMLGDPKTMQQNPTYKYIDENNNEVEDVIYVIKQFFKQQIEKATKAGITQLILDPGIGFGKTLEHNLEIIKRLNEFNELDYPIMIGASRKSFINMINLTNHNKPLSVEDRLSGTLAAHSVCVQNGANILRVHDVKEHKQMLNVLDQLID